MKTLLALLLLIPLNLFAEKDVQKYGGWTDTLDIDDFTDKRVFIVTRWAEDLENKFAIGYTQNGAYLYFIDITFPGCELNNDKTTDVLFRVDKNEVFTLPMKKNTSGMFETDPYEVKERNMFADYLLYKDEMSEGEILRIRVNDEISCKIDLAFDLEDFDKAIYRLREELQLSLNQSND